MFVGWGDSCGSGVGRGTGVGCGDCDGEMIIGDVPVRFEWDLNVNIKFLRPGKYQCTATAADVTEDPPSATTRHALALVSQPVVFDLVENPQWAHSVVAHARSEINRRRCTQTKAPDAQA